VYLANMLDPIENRENVIRSVGRSKVGRDQHGNVILHTNTLESEMMRIAAKGAV
jgi:hypothetical protein